MLNQNYTTKLLNLEDVMTVSYTHLDVYKRQPLHTRCEASVQNKAPPVRICCGRAGPSRSSKKSKEVKEESGEKAGGGKAMHL